MKLFVDSTGLRIGDTIVGTVFTAETETGDRIAIYNAATGQNLTGLLLANEYFDQNGDPYGDIATIKSLIGPFFKPRAAGGGVTGSQDNRVFNSIAARDTFFTSNDDEGNPNYQGLINGHTIAINISNTVRWLAWVGPNNPTSYNNANWQAVNFYAPSLSTDPGESLRIGNLDSYSANHLLGAVNLNNGQRGLSVIQRHNPTGADPIQEIELTTRQLNDRQLLRDQNQPATPYNYQFTVPGPNILLWSQLELVPQEAGVHIFTVRSGSATNEPIIVESITFDAAHIDTPTIYNLNNNVQLNPDEELYITISGARVKGSVISGTWLPYFRPGEQVITYREVIKEDDLKPTVSDPCITRSSNGVEVRRVETIDELEDLALTLRFNAINAENFAANSVLVAFRQGVTEELIATFTGLVEGLNSRALAFTEGDVNNLRGGSGAIYFRLTTGSENLWLGCIDVEPTIKNAPLSGDVILTSAQNYNDLPNKSGAMPYEAINNHVITATGGTSEDPNIITLQPSNINLLFYVQINSANIQFAQATGITLIGSEFPANGDFLMVVAINNAFTIYKLNN